MAIDNLCDKFTLTGMEPKFFWFLKIVGVGDKARAETEGSLLYIKTMWFAAVIWTNRGYTRTLIKLSGERLKGQKQNDGGDKEKSFFIKKQTYSPGVFKEIKLKIFLLPYFNILYFGSINPA